MLHRPSTSDDGRRTTDDSNLRWTVVRRQHTVSIALGYRQRWQYSTTVSKILVALHLGVSFGGYNQAMHKHPTHGEMPEGVVR